MVVVLQLTKNNTSFTAPKLPTYSDTVEYEAVTLRDGLVVLSWQEHIGSTIVHVLDLISGQAYTAVTPAKGGFKRLTGRIEVKSAT